MSTSLARPAAASTSRPAASPDARWAAVQARDARADGRFVYAVRTTGVYCRPSCPSRRPRPEHVAFFAESALARAAGFRACRRCAPDAPPGSASHATRADAAVAAARALLDAADAAAGAGTGNAPRMPLTELARRTGVSAAHLQRAFTRQVGASPARYAAALRAARLRGALRAERTVSAATYAAGYAAPSRVYDAAAAHLGMTPAAYARGGAGVRLWWAAGDTPLGRALVAVTARGVCAAFLGNANAADAHAGHPAVADVDAALEAELAAEFPQAERVRVVLGAGPGGASPDAVGDDADTAARPRLAGALAAVAAAAGGAPAPGEVALDLAGTAWQQQVWAALRAIPAGETRTYAGLAAALGRPTAARALARACATNRVALVVPCHRVVPAGGGVGGYRWGPARKEQLLAAERAAAGAGRENAPATRRRVG